MKPENANTYQDHGVEEDTPNTTNTVSFKNTENNNNTKKLNLRTQ